MLNNLLNHLIEECKRLPGLTVSKVMLGDIGWNPLVDGLIEEFIAKESDRDLEYDKFGNPVFMPKDPAEKEKIRAAWKSNP